MNTIEVDPERAPLQPGREETTRFDTKGEQEQMNDLTEKTREISTELPQPRTSALKLSDIDSAARSLMDSASPGHGEPIPPPPASRSLQTSDAPRSIAVPMRHEVPQALGDDKARAEAPSRPDNKILGADAEMIGAAFVANLEARMAKSGLKDLGWRDRADLAPVMRDLEVLAGASWRAAANLWDKYRPGDPDKPIFIDGDDKDPAPRSEYSETPPVVDPAVDAAASARDDSKRFKSELTSTPAVLARRYLVADNKFYFRDDPNLLAFEDKGKRIATQHNDPLIARSMVELAEAKQWTSIRVKGTDDFRREVWLAASLREMDVEGYTPREVDTARLAELRAQLQPRRQNAIEQGVERRPLLAPTAPARQEVPVESAIDQSIEDQQHAYRSLSKQQRVAVDTLRAILTERGDTAKAIDMATQLATERFQQQRVYVGRLLQHGRAPYEHNPTEKMNYFVTIKTIGGDRTIWGVDLERAIGVGGITQGEDIALLYRGRKRVTITDHVRDPGGETMQKLTKDVNRNSWEVGKLDQLRSEAIDRVRTAAKATEHIQPVVPVYDVPSRRQPPYPDKERGTERVVSR